MPDGRRIGVSEVGVESNRPATNFPGVSVDSNRFDCLDETSGLGVAPRQSESPIKQGCFQNISVAQWLSRLVRNEEAGG